MAVGLGAALTAPRPTLRRASASERSGTASSEPAPYPERDLSAAALRAGKMELDELLLDEEGTFSLSGFQEFTVSIRGLTCSYQALGVIPPTPRSRGPHVAAHPGPV